MVYWELFSVLPILYDGERLASMTPFSWRVARLANCQPVLSAGSPLTGKLICVWNVLQLLKVRRYVDVAQRNHGNRRSLYVGCC